MRLSGKAKDHAIVLALYVFLCILFFNEVILQRQWFGEDFFTQHFPNRYFAAVELSHGDLPLWTPYVFSGMPFFADIQTAVLYPFNILLSLFVSEEKLSYAVYEYQILVHIAFGGYFMYLFLHELELNFLGSLLGGLLFAFNAFFISHAHHAGMVHAGIWLPLVLFFCRRGFTRAPIWFLACPLVLVVSLFAGHPQITIYVCYAFSAYYIFLAYSVKSGLSKSVFNFGLILSAYFLLGAVQILPTIEFLQNTARNVLSYGDAVKDSYPLRSVLSIFMEGLYNTSYESWQQWEFNCYLGVGAILLAVIGAWRRSNPDVSFFVFLAGLSLLLMLGENTPLYKMFYHWMPGFKFFRVPARFGFLFSFSISVLAACGLQDLISRRVEDPNKKIVFLAVFLLVPCLGSLALSTGLVMSHIVEYAVVSAASLLAAYAIMRTGGTREWAQYALVLVILADLFYSRNLHNQMTMTKETLDSVIYQSPVAKALQTENAGERFFAGNKFGSYANMGLVYRRANLSGYNQFQLQLYKKLNLASPETLSLLGAKLVDYDTIALAAEQWKSLPTLETRFNFLVNSNVAPKAFVVAQALADKSFDLQNALTDGFDPLASVYLQGLSSDLRQEPSSVNYFVSRYVNKGNQIELDLDSDAPAYLVVSEVYYPGWRVYVNGVEREVLRADALFRAVRVDKGENHVLFAFQPKSFVIGGIISVIAFMALIVVAGVMRFRA